MIDIKKIEDASHILLVTNNDTFANVSAVYTYLLTLHKKVSLQRLEELDNSLSFLPWFDKCRVKSSSSADYTLEVPSDAKALLEFFKEHQIKINQKMATSLYAGLLQEYDAFKSTDCDGTIFAMASELIALKAEHKKVSDFLLRRVALSTFRLKSIMFASMLLVDEARKAHLYVSDADLKSSGASLNDAYEIMKEAFTLVNVEEVILFKSDDNNKILKEYKEI